MKVWNLSTPSGIFWEIQTNKFLYDIETGKGDLRRISVTVIAVGTFIEEVGFLVFDVITEDWGFALTMSDSSYSSM